MARAGWKIMIWFVNWICWLIFLSFFFFFQNTPPPPTTDTFCFIINRDALKCMRLLLQLWRCAISTLSFSSVVYNDHFRYFWRFVDTVYLLLFLMFAACSYVILKGQKKWLDRVLALRSKAVRARVWLGERSVGRNSLGPSTFNYEIMLFFPLSCFFSCPCDWCLYDWCLTDYLIK